MEVAASLVAVAIAAAAVDSLVVAGMAAELDSTC